MRDDASLAVDPDTDPHLLLLLAETHPEQILDNAALLILPFEDLYLAQDILGTARSSIALRKLEATAQRCGPRALALFAVEVARRAFPRGEWPRPGKARKCLDLAERYVCSDHRFSDQEALEREIHWLGARTTHLRLEEAPAAWALLAALYAVLAGRLMNTKQHAIEAASRSVLALAGNNHLAAAEEREVQHHLLGALLDQHGAQ